VTNPQAQQDAFVEAVRIAATWYTPVELAFWLSSPQPQNDNWTPVQLLGGTRADELLAAVQQHEGGVYL
jgi:hypothetical protein